MNRVFRNIIREYITPEFLLGDLENGLNEGLITTRGS